MKRYDIGFDTTFDDVLEASKKRCEARLAQHAHPGYGAKASVVNRGNQQRVFTPATIYLDDVPDALRVLEGDTGRNFKIGSGRE